MKKIIIVGSPGSGKSYFARQLRDILHYPLYYLDCLFWKENWEHISREELRDKVNEIMKQDTCIIDGNYSSSIEQRFILADTIFFMDIDVEICIESEAQRRGKKREDLPDFLVEEEDPEFVNYIRNFKEEQGNYIYHLIEKYPDKEYHIFHTREEKEDFLKSLTI